MTHCIRCGVSFIPENESQTLCPKCGTALMAVPTEMSGTIAEWIASLSSKRIEDLRRELANALSLTAQGMLRSALLVKALEDRGEDLSGLQIGLLPHLRKIACGQLLPEVVVRFAGKPSLISRIGNLPIQDQRKLATGEPVKLVTFSPDGRQTHRMADPLEMQPDQIRQAFDRDHIRTEAEQALFLDSDRSKRRRGSKRPETVGPMRLDYERDGVTHKGEFISAADLAAALRVLRRRSS